MSLPSVVLSSLRLKPGELFIGREPAEITTVLGSCVAVTLFHLRSGLAAICHAMLPCPHPCPDTDTLKVGDQPFKYVCYAIPEMAAAFRRAGVPAAEIAAKMFGGANVLGTRGESPSSQSVGPANVRLARRLLQQEGLTLKASNVGGQRGRKLVFNTLTGEVLHKHLA